MFTSTHIRLIHTTILVLLVLPMCTTLLAQRSDILDGYVEQALANNLQLKTHDLQYQKQENRIEQARQLWNPQLDLNASYLLAEGGRNIVFPVADLFNPTYTTLNQLTGTNQFPTNLENENIQLTPNNFIDAQLSLTKPLINSTIKYNQLIQSELLKINEIDRQITEQDVIYQTKSSYYNILKSSEGMKILDENLKLLESLYAFNEKLVKYDKATNEILSDVSYQIENLKSQRVQIEEQHELSKALFNLMLNQSLQNPVAIDEYLINLINIEVPDLTTTTTTALNQRREFDKITVAQSVNELNSERINKEKLPTVGLNAGVGIQTEDFNFDQGGPLYTLGIGMSLNILDGGMRKKKMQEITIDQEILTNQEAQLKQQVEIEVMQNYLALRSTASNYQSALSAVKSAERSYDLTKTRYENDKAILIELLEAQNRLTTSELSAALIKYDYLILLAQLDKATHHHE